jgi:glycosyltransferase involved in cell wall biosynthesis
VEKPENYPKITVLICTLNEEANLPYILPRLPEWVDEVLVIDGHSSDRTVEVVREICPQAKVLYQLGKGKGDALLYGFKNALGDIVVSLDADGETDPEDIPGFIEPLMNGYDFAKGSRLARGRPQRMLRYRFLGNKVLVLTCNLLYGTRFTDVCSGFYSLWRDKFFQLELDSNGNELGCSMEQQMIVRAKKAGFKIKEVPHASQGRLNGTSNISGFKQSTAQGFRDWFTIIGERFKRSK